MNPTVTVEPYDDTVTDVGAARVAADAVALPLPVVLQYARAPVATTTATRRPRTAPAAWRA